ncbi:MAG: hypothetical protein LBT86_01945 [Deltaproteobacteria bacterium]|nr:hypothetical protein [Deltaproteobacteria bacterium]
MTLDPFKSLLAENHIVSEQKLAAYVPVGFKAAVALEGASLGELPGAAKLYLLVAEATGEFRTEETVDLAPLGLCQPAGAWDVSGFMKGLGLLLEKLKGVIFLAAKRFTGILPGRLLALDIQTLMEGDFGLESLSTAVNEAMDPAKDDNPWKVEPTQIRPGHYYLDLKQALALDPELTSKKILNPFFQSVKFEKLSLKCDHQPRWLPEAAKRLGYGHEAVQEPDALMVTLAKLGD